MFSGNVQIDMNETAILQRLKANSHMAQAWLDKRVVQDCEPFVPMDTGMLAASARESSTFGSGMIVYNTPYARRLYYGETFSFSRDRHPKATHHWFEKAKSIFLESWGRGVAQILGGIWGRQ